MSECTHKWIFQETQKQSRVTTEDEHRTVHFNRVDVYYCENCCVIKKIEQKESVNFPFGGMYFPESFSPIWY